MRQVVAIILHHSQCGKFTQPSLLVFSGKACGNFAHVLIIIRVTNCRNISATHSSRANDDGTGKLQGWDDLV